MRAAVPYYRVSTQAQGTSGLGLDAQREAVTRYMSQNGLEQLAEFVEVESGRKKQRPQLEAALAMCKREGATLIIAKLDRLGRNVHFITSLMESRVEFIALDNPHANKLMFHLLAAFAEHESDIIRARVTEALAAAKRRGVKLGKYADVLAPRRKEQADAFALQMKPILDELQETGFTTYRAKVDELNRRGVSPYYPTSRWHIRTVEKLQKRLERIARENVYQVQQQHHEPERQRA
jgi:DNA invertase Pin-like site-specific DNA recombinase